ncbi:MAG: HEPN domain-containing protein [Methylococcales bacterium]|nr:HEPN domain-containing protein [Methylococcales bacterium]
MIKVTDLETLALERLLDADALIEAERYDGAIYIAGYAIELVLKARICKTLKWTDFPENQDYRSFKIHNLDVLLHLSGIENEIKTNYFADWSLASKWNPENRYKTNAPVSKHAAELTLKSIKKLWVIL